MKKPKLTAEENRERIAAAGARSAYARFEKNRAALRKVMEEIRAEVRKDKGVYLKGRKITTKEVLKRAGKWPSYLYKQDASQDLKDLRAEVEAFVDEMAGSIPTDVHSVHRAVAGRARAAQSDLEMVRTNYALAELELSDARADLRGKDKTIEELEARVADLLKQLAGRTVVDLPTRRK